MTRLVSRRAFVSGVAGVPIALLATACGGSSPPTAAPAPTRPAEKPAAAAPTTVPQSGSPAPARPGPEGTPAPKPAEKPAASPAGAATKSADAAKPAAVAPVAGGAAVTIRYMHDDSGPRAQTIEKNVLPAFASKYPNVKIQNEPTPFAELLTKIQTQAAAGVLSDVFRSNTRWHRTLAVDGVAGPIDDLLRGSGVLWEEVMPEYKRIWTNDKQQSCGMPDEATTRANAVAPELFEKAGVKLPADDAWTHETMLEAARALTIREGDKVVQWGHFSMPSKGDDSLFEAWLTPNGGHVLAQDLQTSVINSPENVATLQFWADMRFKHRVLPQPADIAGLTAVEQSPIWNGKVAIFTFAPSQKAELARYMKVKSRVVAWPKWKQSGNAFSGGGIAIDAKTKNRDAAFALLTHMTSADMILEMMQGGVRGFPATPRLAEQWVNKVDPPPENFKQYLAEFPHASVTRRALVPGKWTKLAEPMNQLLDRIYLKNEPVKPVLDEIKAAQDKILKEPR
jgi:multiple sugar transport system substrate-binding protein